MKKICLIVFLIPLLASSQVTLDWQQFSGGVAIATDATDNVYTISWDYNPAGDIYLTKHDADGNFLWTVSYNNTDNTRHEVSTWVATDNENNIIVTGTIRSGYASPVDAASVIMKFDPSGNLLWRNVYETTFDGSSTKKCLVDASNNIYVLGLGSGAPGFVTKVKKFAPDGTALWSYFDAAGIGAPINFKFTPDNNIVIVGRGIIGSVNGYAKIDLDGNEIWSYAGINSLTVGDIAGDAAGNSYIINGEYVVGTAGSVLTKLSPSGTFMWDHTNDIAATKVEVGTDNNPIIGGFPNSGSFGVAFMKYTSAGTVVWENLDADGAGFNLMLHAMMKLDPANNAYLAAGTLFEMAVCKVNADGSSGWVAHCSGGYSYGFEFGNDYSLYVVGGSTAHFTQEAIITCFAPEGLYAAPVSTIKARLNWTLEPGAFQYEVWYKKVSAINWKKKFVPGINNKLNLKNLVCNTNYVWKIRTVCDTVGVDMVSDFSPDQFFTTAVCREQNGIPDENISIFPNPATDMLNIVIPVEGSFQIRIFGLDGALVLAQNNDANGTFTDVINVSEWPGGVYILEVTTSEGVFVQKFIITK